MLKVPCPECNWWAYEDNELFECEGCGCVFTEMAEVIEHGKYEKFVGIDDMHEAHCQQEAGD